MARWLNYFLVALYLVWHPPVVLASDYLPTPAEASAVQRLTDAYFHALDNGDYAAAYAMLTPGMHGMASLDDWSVLNRQTQQKLGLLKQRAQVNITWVLYPPDSQGPWLYLAADFVSSYANAKQHTEYLIWFREPGQASFKLMRHESTFMLDHISDVDAEAMKEDGAIQIAVLSEDKPLEEAKGNTIGFKTVAAAREALIARKMCLFANSRAGWLSAIGLTTQSGLLRHPTILLTRLL